MANHARDVTVGFSHECSQQFVTRLAVIVGVRQNRGFPKIVYAN